MAERPSDEEYRDLARCEYLDVDDIEIDDNALVSHADNGAWVQCWRWVYDPEQENDDAPTTD